MARKATESKRPRSQQKAEGEVTPPVPPALREEEFPYLHPLKIQGVNAFIRERERHLAEGHVELEWIAYHGDRLIGIAKTYMPLYKKCAREKIPMDEVYLSTLHPFERRAYLHCY